jgi:CheY-like chemotaxis protein
LIEEIYVLVVEHDEVNAQVARAMLERLGCRVDVAEDGVEAIELFGKNRYHLIFMAWQMPRMDGLEATARIRALPDGRLIPILGTSARIGRMECMAAGMDDVMPKPFRLDNLKLTLSRWTRWKENLQAGGSR